MRKLLTTFIAIAIVMRLGEIDVGVSTTTITVSYDVLYAGTDVPNGFLTQTITLTGSPLGLSTTTINAGVAAAARAQAISDGFTVPVSSVVMQSWQGL